MPAPTRERFPRFADLLDDEPDEKLFARLRATESIGQLLGDDRFLADIERLTRRRLRADKRGPKPKTPANEAQSDLLSALSP